MLNKNFVANSEALKQIDDEIKRRENENEAAKVNSKKTKMI